MRNIFLRYRGLSLIESLVAMAIAALLAALAIAGCRALLDQVRVTTAAADFRAALAAARTAAIRHGQRVDLLPATALGWHTGWIVTIDLNNNQQVDAGEPVLRSGSALHPSVEVVARLTDGSRTYFAFDPSGRPRSAHSATVPQFGSLLFRAGTVKRKLVMGFLGRARLCDPDRDKLAC